MESRSQPLHLSFFAVVLAVFMAFSAMHARADTPAPATPLPLGAWTVTKAASPTNVGLRMFFSPDGVFLMVDPRSGLGVAGSYTVGRTGLLVYVFGYGRSAEFINGTYTIQGDELRIEVKRSGFMEPQEVVLQRMRLQ